MLDIVRYATEAEIEKIKDKCDLAPGCAVVTLGGKEFAVIRNITEVDPVIYEEDTSNSRKVYFAQSIETFLRLTGVPRYFFNIHCSEEKWIANVEHSGAEKTSTAPEFRFRKAL